MEDIRIPLLKGSLSDVVELEVQSVSQEYGTQESAGTSSGGFLNREQMQKESKIRVNFTQLEEAYKEVKYCQ